MKYNLNEMVKPSISKLWIQMKDGSTYPAMERESEEIDINQLYEDFKNRDNFYNESSSLIELVKYIDSERKREINTSAQEPRFSNLEPYVNKLISEILLNDFKEMFRDNFYPFFDFTEHGTIYSKTEFKKCYVNTNYIEK